MEIDRSGLVNLHRFLRLRFLRFFKMQLLNNHIIGQIVFFARIDLHGFSRVTHLVRLFFFRRKQVCVPFVLPQQLFKVLPALQAARGIEQRTIHDLHIPIIGSGNLIGLIVQIYPIPNPVIPLLDIMSRSFLRFAGQHLLFPGKVIPDTL